MEKQNKQQSDTKEEVPVSSIGLRDYDQGIHGQTERGAYQGWVTGNKEKFYAARTTYDAVERSNSNLTAEREIRVAFCYPFGKVILVLNRLAE